ncbi:16S rRNA (cytosine(967)-C(5))-methyltransferase RsmB [Solibaculum mannosilyticum]|uniref:16S rRNA (cytosine(967)-C(5))-methyltransferase RsmB n=1 Tax=Solibaculum mannosilyticum TaxID=2780922 RepID=UPI0034B3D2E6
MTEQKANPRKLAVEALIKLEEQEGYSNLILDSMLQKSKMDPRDAALFSTLFYGVLERKITLDYIITKHSSKPIRKLSPQVLNILRTAIYQIRYLERIPDSAAVDQAVRLTRKFRQTSASGFVNAVLRAVLRQGNVVWPDEKKEPVRNLSVRYSVPEEIVKLWRKSYGQEETISMLEAFQQPRPIYVRANTTRVTAGQLAERLKKDGVEARELPLVPGAVELQGGGSVEQMSTFQEGLFHVQDLASQLCCMAVDPQKEELVADVCAAPGGKSFTLAERMGEGVVYAFDLHDHRVKLMKQGATRLGLTGVKAAVRDANAPDQTGILADRVLCDVPCSGLGVIGRKPEIRYKSLKFLENLPDLQYNILSFSSQMVKPGGKLVYSTCTLYPAENEQVVERFLQEHDTFQLEPVKLPSSVLREQDIGKGMVTLLPHRSGGDGFFVACFVKKTHGGVHAKD